MKFFLKSKTILGVILAALPSLATAFGLNFGADDAAMISGAVDQIIEVVGALLAVYGRFAAGGISIKPNAS